MRTILPIFLILTSLLLALSSSLVLAQYEAPDPTLFPSNPTCDLCGGCRDAGGNLTKPSDWEGCRNCIYGNTDPDTRPLTGKMWTPLGCIDTVAGSFVQTILRFVVAITGGLAFLGFIWGGFQLLTAAGDPLRIASGKSTVLAAGGALLLILFAVFLLEFIGVKILGIPGLGR